MKTVLEGGISRSYCVENWVWNRLWSCQETYCGIDGRVEWTVGWPVGSFDCPVISSPILWQHIIVA
jgi:hypothetical protein